MGSAAGSSNPRLMPVASTATTIALAPSSRDDRQAPRRAGRRDPTVTATAGSGGRAAGAAGVAGDVAAAEWKAVITMMRSPPRVRYRASRKSQKITDVQGKPEQRAPYR